MICDVTDVSKWHFEGPFTVLRKNRAGAYVMQNGRGALKRVVPSAHLNLLVRNGDKAVIEENTEDVKVITNHRTEKNGKMRFYVVWKNKDVQAGWKPVEDFNDVDVIRRSWTAVRPTRKANSMK